jgi:REP element-mobilizing transposase RayT
MPNHVHVLVTPHGDIDLSTILHSWKSYTGNRVNEIVGERGSLWQQESFNHLVRSKDQFDHFRRYIRRNPEKARLQPAEYVWWDALGEVAD